MPKMSRIVRRGLHVFSQMLCVVDGHSLSPTDRLLRMPIESCKHWGERDASTMAGSLPSRARLSADPVLLVA